MNRESNGIVWNFILLCLWTLDGYMGEKFINVGGLGILYHFFTLPAILVLGFLGFLVSPYFGRVKALMSFGAVRLFPVIFPLIWSLMIWMGEASGLSQMRRGIVSVSYLVMAIMAIGVTIYISGEKAVWLYLYSLILANSIYIFKAVSLYGIAAVAKDFGVLLVTFAGTTGTIMRSLEIHYVTYGLGCYLLYFLLLPEQIREHKVSFLLTVLCYLTGLKRISVLAVLLGVLLGHMLYGLKKCPSLQVLIVGSLKILVPVGAFLYVAALHAGLYDYLEAQGFDTSYRDVIYGMYREFYRISPAFIGYGTGWVKEISLNGLQGKGNITYGTHTDFLKMYLEVGMIGSFIWNWLEYSLQIGYSFRCLGNKGGILCVGLLTHFAITILTDSTSGMIIMNSAITVLLLSFGLKEREQRAEEKIDFKNRMQSDSY